MQTLNTVMDYSDTPVKDLQHPPVPRVVAIEERHEYPQITQSLTNSIRGVYLVNTSVVYHHCSFVPLYELQYLYSIIDSDEADCTTEFLQEDIDESDHPDLYLDHLPASTGWAALSLNHLIDPEEVAEGQTIGELMKDVKEYLICNHPF